MKKKSDYQGYALKLLLMYSLKIQQDILLWDIEPLDKDRVSLKKLKEIIKVLEG